MTPDDLARRRFGTIMLLRVVGWLVMLGGMILIGRSEGQGYAIAGATVFAAGAVIALLVPQRLARRWRSERR